MRIDIAALSPALNLSAYHPDAVATARKGAIQKLDTDLALIRLIAALEEENWAEADAVIAHLDANPPQGWAACQHLTAALYLKARKDDQAGFDFMLEQWLEGRAQWPDNWSDDILDTPPLATMLRDFDRSRLAKPERIPVLMTDEERAFVKDEKAVIKAAVAENLGYLREMGITDTPEQIAKGYTLTSVNLGLREAVLGGGEAYPDLIAAFDEQGIMIGSFIAH